MLILADLALPTQKKKGAIFSYNLTSKSMNAKALILNTITAVLYIVKLSAHLRSKL